MPPGALIGPGLLQLQRAAGNRAVSGFLDAASRRTPQGVPAIRVQRLGLDHHAVNDDPPPEAKNCFTAVLTWLLASQRNVRSSATAIDMIIDKGHAGPLMAKVLARATQLTRPSKRDRQLRVSPGKIIIFSANGSPSHAAVATGRLQITGYNQTHWFRQPADVLSHSGLEGVEWVSETEIVNTLGRRENVHEVDPATAVEVFA